MVKHKQGIYMAILCFLVAVAVAILLYSGTIFQRGNPLPYLGKMLAISNDKPYAKVFDDANVYITKKSGVLDLIRHIEHTYDVSFEEQMGNSYFFSAQDRSIVAETEVYWRNYLVWALEIQRITPDSDIDPQSTDRPLPERLMQK